MSDCMQFSTAIYTDRDNNPGVHSLLTRVHKSEVHIVSKLYGATMSIMFRHEVSIATLLPPLSVAVLLVRDWVAITIQRLAVGGFFEDAEPHMVFAEVEGLRDSTCSDIPGADVTSGD